MTPDQYFTHQQMFEALLKAYVELNRLNASPGDRAHMLAYSIQWVERRLDKVVKQKLSEEWGG